MNMVLRRSQDTQNWLQSSVQSFLETCNWNDHSIEVQEIKLAAVEADRNPEEISTVETLLPYHLSVQEFFAAVNWDGALLNSAVIEAPALTPDESDFTLADFSNLF